MSSRKQVSVRVQDVEHLRDATIAYDAGVRRTMEERLTSLNRRVEQAESESRRRAGELKARKAEVERAAAALSACRANCGPLVSALNAARAREAEAEASHKMAVEAVSKALDAAGTFQARARAVVASLERHVRPTIRTCERMIEKLNSYLRVELSAERALTTAQVVVSLADLFGTARQIQGLTRPMEIPQISRERAIVQVEEASLARLVQQGGDALDIELERRVLRERLAIEQAIHDAQISLDLRKGKAQ